MNKTDRLLAIVLELQRKKLVRAEDLAAVFETSVRTIYRDIQALSEAGVPVVGSTGRGYSLMEGYFLPPVSFTMEEAVTLLIGMDLVEQQFDAEYGIRAQASRGKIEAILPEKIRREASRVRQTMRLLTSRKDAVFGQEQEGLKTIRRAILEGRKIEFNYTKTAPGADGTRHSVRIAAPYGLALVQGTWMLIAHCDVRQGIRHFRLSRMSGLSVLENRFEIPADFNLQDYEPPDDRSLQVRLLVNRSIADKVKESGSYYMEAAEDHPDGLLVRFRVRQPEDVLHFILGWGADAVVLEPESLRKRVREEAENMLKRY